jgi:hypothetical protein
MSNQVVAWAPFRLKPETEEASLLRVADEVQREFLSKQEGSVVSGR